MIRKITPFGHKLEILQVDNGMNTKELAAKMGISSQGVSNLKYKNKPRPATMKRLADIFNVPARFFLDMN